MMSTLHLVERSVTLHISSTTVPEHYGGAGESHSDAFGTTAVTSAMNCTTVERISTKHFTVQHIIIATALVLLIFFTVIGNTLVILSVTIYQRMRTFTNKLLTSLATADLLVGLFVMPLSLLDLLLNHAWPFSMLLCRIWSTSDVLFCTASILNLCVISIDRYMAITSPLRYSRRRNRKTAALLLGSVWLISFVVCSPPWIFHIDDYSTSVSFAEDIPGSNLCLETHVCTYPNVIMYRIYSSMASFFIPLLLMCSVYYKIFRVASRREKMMRKNISSQYGFRTAYQLTSEGSNCCNQNRARCASAVASGCQSSGDEQQKITGRLENVNSEDGSVYWRYDTQTDCALFSEKEEMSVLEQPTAQDLLYNVVNVGLSTLRPNRSLCELTNDKAKPPMNRQNTDDGTVLTMARRAQQCHSKPQPRCLLAKAQDHYQTYGPGKIMRNSREKLVYMKERKALKTIAIVFFAFTICWFPFFVLYLVEVLVSNSDGVIYATKEVCLWLGYSNSVLNPIIYTMYNHDFRRCFRDLLTFGCLKQRRSMSIRKLHQQKTAC